MELTFGDILRKQIEKAKDVPEDKRASEVAKRTMELFSKPSEYIENWYRGAMDEQHDDTLDALAYAKKAYEFIKKEDCRMTIKEMARRWDEYPEMEYSEQQDFLKALARCVAYRYGVDGLVETESIDTVSYSADEKDKYSMRVEECITYYNHIRVRIWYKTQYKGVFVERMDTITAEGGLKKLFRYIESVTGWEPVAHDEDAQVVFMDIED